MYVRTVSLAHPCSLRSLDMLVRSVLALLVDFLLLLDL